MLTTVFKSLSLTTISYTNSRLILISPAFILAHFEKLLFRMFTMFSLSLLRHEVFYTEKPKQ